MLFVIHHTQEALQSNYKCFFFSFWFLFVSESAMAISVQCPIKRYIVILFQPVTLTCNYQTSASQFPVVTWKYKSYCRDPIQAALNPSSAENILSQNNPNYDPNIECADSQRTVAIVASKQGPAVSLGENYQGRKISILNSELIKVHLSHWNWGWKLGYRKYLVHYAMSSIKKSNESVSLMYSGTFFLWLALFIFNCYYNNRNNSPHPPILLPQSEGLKLTIEWW